MYGGGVGKASAPAVIGDVSNEETVYRPEVASRGTRVPLDPFAPVNPSAAARTGRHARFSGVVTGGSTGGYSSELGHAVDPRYAQFDGSTQGGPVSAAPFSGVPMSAQPFSGAPQIAQHLAPYSAPPQAPVSMQPPPGPWARRPGRRRPRRCSSTPPRPSRCSRRR